MTITYIYHSCFAIEHNNTVLVFDYYKQAGKLPDIVKRAQKAYIFSSHSHGDHFNPEIFKWAGDNVTYILSSDIHKNYVKPGAKTAFLSENETYGDDCLSVRAYGSTDCGVSYLVTLDGKTVFHAGDLNNWHWNEYAPPGEVAYANKQFLEKLDNIQNENNHIDIVMFPCDPRLGRDFCKGAAQFISAVKTGLFIPMHFGEEYNKANSFKDTAKKTGGCEFFTIQSIGDSMEFN